MEIEEREGSKTVFDRPKTDDPSTSMIHKQDPLTAPCHGASELHSLAAFGQSATAYGVCDVQLHAKSVI
jgi:hypothetical protein